MVSKKLAGIIHAHQIENDVCERAQNTFKNKKKKKKLLTVFHKTDAVDCLKVTKTVETLRRTV